MKDRKLAARYARALLAALPDRAEAESADTFLTSLARAMDGSVEFRGLMLDPSVSRAQRKAALGALAQAGRQQARLVNFLNTLTDNGRTAALPAIAAQFHEAREESQGIVSAEMSTAEPMSEELQQRARTSLEKLTGRQVQLTCKTDPEVIGGAVTRIGSTIYDGSLRTQLRQLRTKMTQE